MLVPIQWLKDYTDLKVDVDVFCDRMIMSGSNIETAEEFCGTISGVVVGKILSIERHPDADKLVITQIDVGTEVLQIVTGASNIAVGDLVPVVKHGGKLPGGVTIKKGKLRGVESNGMLCSAKELGFEDKVIPVVHKDGIWILNEEFSLGQDFVEALGLHEHVVDFEITPNRPDCLSMIGMARETAAVFGEELHYPTTACKKEAGEAKEHIQVEIKKPELCRRYAARVVTDVKIAQSPWWLQKRLIFAGMRPINNIVDITNFVMLEYGQPIHAFDIRTVEEGRIVVDTAPEGTLFTTLDGTERKLPADVLMINDGKKPLAIAGIMGGMNSEIEADTTTILVESANFNGDSVRSSSKKLGLRTEASSRFEKGIDANLCERAADRVCELIEELGAGTVTKGIVDAYPTVQTAKIQEVRVDRVNHVLGIELSAEEMIDIFNSLEMRTEHSGNIIRVTPPTVRQDLEAEIDYVEEVARMFGYDKMPVTLPKSNTEAGKTRKQQLRDLAKEALTGMGLNETQTYSFVSPRGVDNINLPKDSELRNFVKLINPLGEENSVMRTLLTPNMLEVLGRNYSRNVAAVKAFEIGNVFRNVTSGEDQLPEEHDSLVIGAYGSKESFYTLKGIVNEMLTKLGIREHTYQTQENNPVYHPGRCADIMSGGEILGTMGELHPDVAEHYGIGTRVYCCELNFGIVMEQANVEKYYAPLPKYPATSRDIALLVKEDVKVADIEVLIKKMAGSMLEDVALFDVYRGKQIAEGMKSAAFTLTYRAADRTLTDGEVVKVHDQVLEALKQELDAVLREI